MRSLKQIGGCCYFKEYVQPSRKNQTQPRTRPTCASSNCSDVSCDCRHERVECKKDQSLQISDEGVRCYARQHQIAAHQIATKKGAPLQTWQLKCQIRWLARVVFSRSRYNLDSRNYVFRRMGTSLQESDICAVGTVHHLDTCHKKHTLAHRLCNPTLKHHQ